MVKIKLKELAKRLDKNISDIARETKLNRNTVTALYHNKVNGIDFLTLDKICKTYKVKISEIKNKPIKIELNPEDIEIEEVVVSALSPVEMLKLVLKKIKTNPNGHSPVYI